MPKNFMKFVSVGIQAGGFDSRLLGGYVIDLLAKCHEIYQKFKQSNDELEASRARIVQMAGNMDSLQTTLNSFTDTVDTLGVRVLQENAAISNKQLQIEHMKREIESKKEQLQKLSKAHQDRQPLEDREQQMRELTNTRGKLELQLSAILRDIESTYEEVFTTGERIEHLTQMRKQRQDDHDNMLEGLKSKCDHTPDFKHQILSADVSDDVINLSDIYVSPTDFRRMQFELEDLKRKQMLVDKHIEMQLSERDFLKQTAVNIAKKVYDLERKVRKENGDHGYDSAFTKQPCWYQNLGAPGIWYIPSSSIAWNQLDRITGPSQALSLLPAPVDLDNATKDYLKEEVVAVENINNDVGTSV